MLSLLITGTRARHLVSLILALTGIVSWSTFYTGSTSAASVSASFDYTADHPLTTLTNFQGQVDVVVKVDAQNDFAIGIDGWAYSGSFTLTASDIPQNARILRAWFIKTTNGNEGSGSPTGDLGFTVAFKRDNPLPPLSQTFVPKTADNTDNFEIGVACREYRYDVTSLVTGAGSYSYTVTGDGNSYFLSPGDALVIVYEHPDLPTRKIVISDGAEAISYPYSSLTSFAGFSAGAGRLIVFSEHDNVGIQKFPISLLFNTQLVSDDFHNNQGPYVNLIDIPVNVLAGTNTMEVFPYVFSGTYLHLGILVGPPAPCTPPPAGLVAWLPGDGNTQDIQGANHGTLKNGATFAPGMVGQAFSLDGVNDYVEAPSNQSLNIGTGDLTIDAWIKPDSVNQVRPIVSRDNTFGFSMTGYSLDLTSGKLAFVTGDGTTFGYNVSSATIPVGVWTHVAATLNRSNAAGVPSGITLYINGVATSSTPGTVPGSIDAAVPLLIGRRPPNNAYLNHPGFFFDGVIDEVEIFNRAIGESEIQAIYNAGGSGKCRSCVQPPPNMVAWLPGDGNANDIAGTNHGTLQNGATFAPGRVGQAFSLNGTGAFVQAPDSPALNPGSQLTIDAWINPVSLVSNGQANRIVDKITGGFTNGYNFDIRYGRLRAIFGTNIRTGATVIPLNTWTHVAAVYDGTQLKLYVNGMLDTVSTAGGVIPSNTLPLRIGADSNGNSLFDGRIDEVEIFNRALSQAEILAIVNAGGAGKCK